MTHSCAASMRTDRHSLARSLRMPYSTTRQMCCVLAGLSIHISRWFVHTGIKRGTLARALDLAHGVAAPDRLKKMPACLGVRAWVGVQGISGVVRVEGGGWRVTCRRSAGVVSMHRGAFEIHSHPQRQPNVVHKARRGQHTWRPGQLLHISFV